MIGLLLVVSGCAPNRREAELAVVRCLARPSGARAVPWRTLPGKYSVDGGTEPQLPNVSFPVRDAATFDKAFPKLAGQVDFSRERVEVLHALYRIDPGWVAVHQRGLLVKTRSSVWCGGMRRETFGTLLVVPRSAPPLRHQTCSAGGACSGPPRP